MTADEQLRAVVKEIVQLDPREREVFLLRLQQWVDAELAAADDSDHDARWYWVH